MLVFVFAIAIASTVFSAANAATNCSVCELDDDFAPSSGYGCFPLRTGQVACTCPDQRYTLNKPCRICERPNICGIDPATLCSEVAETVSDAESNSTHYFSCFCADFTFYVGQGCPAVATTTVTRPSTTTTTTAAPSTTTVTQPITTTTITTTAAPVVPAI